MAEGKDFKTTIEEILGDKDEEIQGIMLAHNAECDHIRAENVDVRKLISAVSTLLEG